MIEAPKEIWCSTGLYYEYKTDWSEGEWSVRPDLSHIKYVRADRIEELEDKLSELLTTVEQAIETYRQPHYGDTDTELDHAYDAINLLREAVKKLKGDKP